MNTFVSIAEARWAPKKSPSNQNCSSWFPEKARMLAKRWSKDHHFYMYAHFAKGMAHSGQES